MEPGSFRIKRVGEDLPTENTESLEHSQEQELEELNSPVISPSSQAEKSPLRLANRGAVNHSGSTSSQSDLSCPECNAPINSEAVICVACGYNIKKGKKVKTKYQPAKKSKASFPNQHRSQSRRVTKPSAFSNFLFMLVFFGGIGGGVWYFFFKPLPPIYGPHKEVDMSGAKFKPKDFEIVYENGNDKNSVSINAWREMEAHFNEKKNTMLIKAKKNAKKFKDVKMLTFKKPKSIYRSKIEICFNSEDYEYFRKKHGDSRSPEEIARAYMIAMVAKDGNGIKAVTLPNPNAKILWEGRKPGDSSRMKDVDFIDLQVGANMFPASRKAVRVTAAMLGNNRKILQPILAGQILPTPILMAKVRGEWKVDASDIIGARMRVSAKSTGQIPGQFPEGSAQYVAHKFLMATVSKNEKTVRETTVPGTENKVLWDTDAPEKLINFYKNVIFKIPSIGDQILAAPETKITVTESILNNQKTILIPVYNGRDFPFAVFLQKGPGNNWKVNPSLFVKSELAERAKKGK